MRTVLSKWAKTYFNKNLMGFRMVLDLQKLLGFIVNKAKTEITLANIICSVLSVGVSKWVTQHQIQCTDLGHGAAL